MAKFSQTGEIQRTAPGDGRAVGKRIKGFKRFKYFVSGLDEYGRPAKGAQQKLGMLTNIGTLGLGTLGVKKDVRGTSTGAVSQKAVSKQQAESLKTAAEIALTIASFGGYAGIAAGTKAASAAAKGATGLAKVGAAAKGYKAGTAAYKATKAGTTAVKAGSALGQKAVEAGSKESLKTGTQLVTDTAAEKGTEVVLKSGSQAAYNWGQTGTSEVAKGAEKYFASKAPKAIEISTAGTPLKTAAISNKAMNAQKIGNWASKQIGGDTGKVVGDFIKEAGKRGDQKFGEFAKQYVKNNKAKLKEVGVDEAQKLLDKAWAKYDKENPDAQAGRSDISAYKQKERPQVEGKYMMYKKGGLLKGKSHAQGGEKAVIGENKIELEGDERVFSKKDTKKMDKAAESKNYTALGKMYAEAKGRHDAAEETNYGEKGMLIPKENLDDFKTKIADIESKGDYKAMNTSGSSATGKYQWVWSQWGDKIMEATGVKTQQEFLDSPEIQEKFTDYMFTEGYEGDVNALKKKYPEKTKDMSDSQLTALVHFQGRPNAENYFETGATANAENNITVEKYLEPFKEEATAKEIPQTQQFQVYNSKTQEWHTIKANQGADGKMTYSSPNLKQDQVDKLGRGFYEEARTVTKGGKNAKGQTYYGFGGEYGAWQTYDVPNVEKLSASEKARAITFEKAKEKKEYQDYQDAQVQKKVEEKAGLIDAALKEWNDVRDDLQTAERRHDPETVYKLKKLEAQKRKAYLTQKKNFAESEYRRRVNGATARQQAIKSELDRLERDGVPLRDERYGNLMNEYDNLDFYVDDMQQRKNLIAEGTNRFEDQSGAVGWFEAGELGSGNRQEGTFGTKRETYAQNVKGMDNSKPLIDEISAKVNPKPQLKDSKVLGDEVKDIVLGKNLPAVNIKPDTPPTPEESERLKFDDIKDVTPDLQAEQDLDVSVISDEQLEEYYKTREVREEATGLSSVIKKFGGMDTVLQMTGMAAAYKSAVEPLPQQKKSAAWKDYMATMKQRSQMGMSPESKTLFQRQAERTYASDVSNIGRMATSGQAALGALGQASDRKYMADIKMGAEDARIREQNFKEFGSALAQDEKMTQDMWERNVYNEAARKRDLKSGLIGQAVKNVRDDMLYNKQYGDGSLYDQLMQETIQGKQLANKSMLISQEKAMNEAGETLFDNDVTSQLAIDTQEETDE